MAVDTANKRASCFGGDGDFCITFPQGDGTIGSADRQQVVGDYAGVLASGGTPEPSAGDVAVVVVLCRDPMMRGML